MKQKKLGIALSACVFGAVPSYLSAGPTHDHDHDHGKAQMVVVIEADTISMTLEADLLDLVGFERAPGTPSEEALIDQMHEALSAGDALFALPSSAGCESTSAETSGGYKADLDRNAPENATHIVTGNWSWSCSSINRLRKVDVLVFDAFPAIESVQTVIFADSAQSGAVLTPKKTELTLP